MEFLNKFKEKKLTACEKDITLRASQIIHLADFDNQIFIAYNNTPLVAVDATWTQKEILEKLSDMRYNYINAKTKELKQIKTSAVLLL